MFEYVLQTVAIWVFIPLLVVGWSICLAQPLWDFVALWRTSRMPLVEPTLPEAKQGDGEMNKPALRRALSMLIAAEGTGDNIGRLLPRGVRDLDFLAAYAALFVAGVTVGSGAFYLDMTLGGSWPVLDIFMAASVAMVASAVLGSVVGVFSMIMALPGLGNAEDSLIAPINAQNYYARAQRILRGAKFHSPGMDVDPPSVVDPAQTIYQSNKPLWVVLAFVRFPLLSAVRWMRLGPEHKALVTAARQLREEVEAALGQPAQGSAAVRRVA